MILVAGLVLIVVSVPLTGGRLREEELPEVLYSVRSDANDLRRVLIGE